MLAPAFIDLSPTLHAFGDTPAVSLSQDLPPSEGVKALLLGCGDVRNILFTLFNEDDNATRTFDFTCCDVEKIIIARNILLLTLILDDEDGSRSRAIWNIQYHFYLDDNDLKLLGNQSKKLYDLSSSLQKWHNSEYGRLFRVCDQGTLDQIRPIWNFYDITKLTASDAITFKQRFYEKHQITALKRMDTDVILAGVRSAAPVSTQMIQDIMFLDVLFWKHGTLDADAVEKEKLYNYPNPTLAASAAGTFMVDWKTDPLLAFGLAVGFIATNEHPETTQTQDPLDEYRLAKVAMSQFFEWSKAFREHARGKLTMRFFIGDALSLSHTLQYAQTCNDQQRLSANHYRSPYRMERLCLDGGDYGLNGKAPTQFNVIDTSDLSDHVGVLNLLVAAAPLLEDRPSATLYTDIPLRHEYDEDYVDMELLCGDFATVALLLGLYPLEHWTDNTAFSSSEEGFLSHCASDAEPRMRLPWKHGIPVGALNHVDTSLYCDERSLARFLFRLQKKMLESQKSNWVFPADEDSRGDSLSLASHYHLGSFVALLRLIKSKVKTDWGAMMETLIDLVSKDSALPLAKKFVEEFHLDLHLAGVHSVSLYSISGISVRPVPERFSGWGPLPEYLCVTVKVPRACVTTFKKARGAQFGTPDVYCALQPPKGGGCLNVQNNFANVQLAFGQISSTGAPQDADYQIKIIEDEAGWAGKSPLFVSFKVPTVFIVLEHGDSSVVFKVRHVERILLSDFESSKRNDADVGATTDVYAVPIGNREAVFFTRYQPGQPGPRLFNAETIEPKTPSTPVKNRTIIKGIFNEDCSRLASFVARMEFAQGPEKAQLRAGALVKTKQITPDVISVSIGSRHNFHIRYPFPINESKRRTRIGRKSASVELEAPIIPISDEVKCCFTMCPLFAIEDSPVVWNSPRINLSRLSSLDLQAPRVDLEWLALNTKLMFSQFEGDIRAASIRPNATNRMLPRTNFKSTLFAMFTFALGMEGKKCNIFALNDKGSGGTQMIIFISAIRLDLGNHTLVLDTAIIPIHNANVPNILPILPTLTSDNVFVFKLGADEMILWKKLLPAFVERCRTWEHRPSCEYLARRLVPLSTEINAPPICSCGNGILPPLKRFPAELTLAADQAVRAAISPQYSGFAQDVGGALGGLPETVFWDTCLRKTCYECGAQKEGLLQCAGCKLIRYCSKACQKKGWKRHKVACRRVQ